MVSVEVLFNVFNSLRGLPSKYAWITNGVIWGSVVLFLVLLAVAILNELSSQTKQTIITYHFTNPPCQKRLIFLRPPRLALSAYANLFWISAPSLEPNIVAYAPFLRPVWLFYSPHWLLLLAATCATANTIHERDCIWSISAIGSVSAPMLPKSETSEAVGGLWDLA
jgi:hypothetical protein